MVSPMKPFNYYSTNTISYPNKKDYITIFVYDKGKCLYEGNDKSKTKLMAEYPGAVIQEVLDEVTYKEHRKLYDAEAGRLHQEFKEDLFKEFGMSDHPKREKIFSYAWEEGHSCGLEDVYNVFADIVELIID